MESDAHFVKSAPHFSDMHLRNAASHAFAVVMFVPPVAVAPVSPAASSSARCRRIVSASAAFDESVALAPISERTLLNCDVLLLTMITGSKIGSGAVVVTGVGSDSDTVVTVVAVSVTVDADVGIRVAVDGVRFCVRFAAAAVAVVGRAVVAACAIFATAIIAKIESPQKIFKFVFIFILAPCMPFYRTDTTFPPLTVRFCYCRICSAYYCCMLR